ncbi:PH domain-containing protein [Agrococcus carbonis]|uniref:Putative membrane protein n=1 Tax=Agrococcus carbonis TaxID=684552 RepID=A0A1H1QE22_9MICO|nr:PH domain-containing protein [Agrococcus carbonis]SDS21527.1 putative membrane protein [Agrococcus carbonis]
MTDPRPPHPAPAAAPASVPQATEARAKAIDLVDGEWHRLHPATPLLRGGLALIIFLGVIVSSFRDRLIGAFVPSEFDEWNEDPFGDFIVDQILWVALGVVVLVLVLIALFWLAWRVHRFRITGDAVEVEQGILVKKHRRAPLARIQGINIRKPWFARLLGACKFEIQQAGSDSNVDLNYLSSSVADALRYEILNRASGRSTADADRLAAARQAGGGVVDELLRPDAEIAHLAPDSLVRIPVRRIVLSSLLDGWIVWALLYVVGTLVVIFGFQQWWAIFAILPAAIAFFAAGMRSLGAKLRYSIAATPDGIRLAYGLASTTTEILPPGRIFALQVKQPLLWRPFGWWQVTFTRAGRVSSDGSGQSGQAQQMANYLLPVGDLRDVRTVIGLVLPELAHSPLIDQGLMGQAPDAFVVSPPRARPFRWFSVRRNGFHVHDAAFVLRHGRIWRSMQLVPQARVQSVAVQQGPIYGLARLARVQFHVPGSVLSPSLGAIDQQHAATLFEHAMRTVKAGIDRDASESWAASLTRNAVLETAPAVQDGLMPAPVPQPRAPWAPPADGAPASFGQRAPMPQQQPQPWAPPQPQPPALQQPWQPPAQQQPWPPQHQPWPPQHQPPWPQPPAPQPSPPQAQQQAWQPAQQQPWPPAPPAAHAPQQEQPPAPPHDPRWQRPRDER